MKFENNSLSHSTYAPRNRLIRIFEEFHLKKPNSFGTEFSDLLIFFVSIWKLRKLEMLTNTNFIFLHNLFDIFHFHWVHESIDFFIITIFTGWIPYVTPWYAEMVEYCLKNDESVLLKPHPTDLSKFIMCNNYGILFEMHCPTGTLFDAKFW